MAVIVLLIIPFVWWHSHCRCVGDLLKLPDMYMRALLSTSAISSHTCMDWYKYVIVSFCYRQWICKLEYKPVKRASYDQLLEFQ